MFKKADLIIYVFLAITLVGMFTFATPLTGSYAVIYSHGEEYGRYNLSYDRIISIDNRAAIEIKDKSVYFISSTCENQVCVKSGKCKAGQPVICAPQGIILRIEGKGGDVDAITY